MQPGWVLTEGSGSVVAVALHDGHEVRPEVAALLAVTETDRWREEVAYAFETRPACLDAGAHRNGALELVFERIAQVAAGERADLRLVVPRIADA